MSTLRNTTIRPATAADAVAVERLAQLEGVRPPTGEFLVGEVDGELWAAVDIEHDEAPIADPFRPSGELAELLRLETANGGRR